MGALVALYGEKPVAFKQLISECQAQIISVAGPIFQPYDVRQVHATITGFGGLIPLPQTSACFHEHRGNRVQMDFDGFLRFFRGGGCLPFQIQIGGFRNRDYPFTSRGLRPFERSFAFRDNKAVVMGWPIRGTPNDISDLSVINLIHEARIYPNTLDEYRHSLQTFGFRHRYYKNIGDVDNDFYFRIGLYDQSSVSEQLQYEIEYKLRQFLSKSQPLLLEIGTSEIYMVFSKYETLQLDSTTVWEISSPNITADSIMSFGLQSDFEENKFDKRTNLEKDRDVKDR
jgi:hypothetical protein